MDGLVKISGSLCRLGMWVERVVDGIVFWD